MRTCPTCGCYIPDNWTTCPACNSTSVKNTSIYRVDVLYDYKGTKTQEFFGLYENAHSYAIKQAKKSDVLAALIIYQGRILMTIKY